jgi:hypothetical protein
MSRPVAPWNDFRQTVAGLLTSPDLVRVDRARHHSGGQVMHPKARYVFTASLDVDPAKEDLFNEIYDTEHVPFLLKVPGVLAVTRVTSEPGASMRIDGQKKALVAEGEPKYSAIYELESAEVLLSDDWAKAVDQGRWPKEIRPYIRARRHTLKKIMR